MKIDEKNIIEKIKNLDDKIIFSSREFDLLHQKQGFFKNYFVVKRNTDKTYNLFIKDTKNNKIIIKKNLLRWCYVNAYICLYSFNSFNYYI